MKAFVVERYGQDGLRSADVPVEALGYVEQGRGTGKVVITLG